MKVASGLLLTVTLLAAACSLQNNVTSKQIFPEAVTVKAYSGAKYLGIDVDSRGTVTTARITDRNGNFVRGVPAMGGEPLTRDEIDTLRNSVSFTKPPAVLAMCCEPRHAFIFFDRNDRFI